MPGRVPQPDLGIRPPGRVGLCVVYAHLPPDGRAAGGGGRLRGALHLHRDLGVQHLTHRRLQHEHGAQRLPVQRGGEWLGGAVPRTGAEQKGEAACFRGQAACHDTMAAGGSDGRDFGGRHDDAARVSRPRGAEARGGGARGARGGGGAQAGAARRERRARASDGVARRLGPASPKARRVGGFVASFGPSDGHLALCRRPVRPPRPGVVSG
mmetsp:Transcript_22770/g.71431  ORF Transcript_22770/g.71431 Transcript_22770/m.71431 type:complete len:211 (-) Transcript_22770:112-744(-)